MRETSLQEKLEFFQRYLPSLKWSGKPEVMALCPFHEENNPSLSVNLEKGVYHCHGCGSKGGMVDFAAALNIPQQSIPGWESQKISWTPDGIFTYRDENSTPLYRAKRFLLADGSKSFVFENFADGLWKTGMNGTRRVLYRLPDIIKPSAFLVFIVEGERKAETLQREIDAKCPGTFQVTCSPGGAGKWRDEYSEFLKGRAVIILPDNDGPGHNHALKVAESVKPFAKSIRIVELPGLEGKGDDIEDWLKVDGNTLSKFLDVVDNTPEWTDSKTLTQISCVTSLPKMGANAFHGIAGKIVNLIAPHTEADSVSILIQFLVGFGNLIGGSAYLAVEADQHPGRLFCVLVGETSRGRKGTSWGWVKKILQEIDAAWTKSSVKGGLSSGEGLVWAVRDPVFSIDGILKDEGVQDKRLLIQESEFGLVLRNALRQGNIISPILRLAWDTGDLSTTSKNTPAKATGAHVSLVGHITKYELLKYLDNTELANGLANRILWIRSNRSQLLADGGNLQWETLLPFIEQLRETVSWASMAGELQRSAEFKVHWREVYPLLSEGRPGLLGAVTGRAEAQVVRLAVIYALLDQSEVIQIEHLKAALAVWDYCDKSVQDVFGDKIGDPQADALLRELRSRPGGMTRTEIRDFFGRNLTPARMEQILSALETQGFGRSTAETSPGRPVERWSAT